MSREQRKIQGVVHYCCAKCKAFFPAGNFYMQKGVPHSWCRPCYKGWRAVRREAWPSEQPAPKRRPRVPAVAPTCGSAIAVQRDFLRMPAANAGHFTGFPMLRANAHAHAINQF